MFYTVQILLTIAWQILNDANLFRTNFHTAWHQKHRIWNTHWLHIICFNAFRIQVQIRAILTRTQEVTIIALTVLTGTFTHICTKIVVLVSAVSVRCQLVNSCSTVSQSVQADCIQSQVTECIVGVVEECRNESNTALSADNAALCRLCRCRFLHVYHRQTDVAWRCLSFVELLNYSWMMFAISSTSTVHLLNVVPTNSSHIVA